MSRPIPATDRTRRPRGVAMLLVLIAVVVATVVSVGFMNAQATSTAIAQNIKHTASARVIAESGLAMAIEEIKSDPSWRTAHANGTWANAVAFNGGTLTIKVEDGTDTDGDGDIDGDSDLDDDALEDATVTAIGAANGVTHTVRAVITGESGAPFTPGIAVNNSASFDSYAVLNSYESSRGAYSATNQGSSGTISTNSTSAGKIAVAGGAQVKGDAYAGVGGSASSVISVDATSSVTGTRAALTSAVTIPTAAAPALPGSLLVDLVVMLGLFDVTSDMKLNNLTIMLTTLRVSGNVRITVENDVNLLLGGRIYVYPGSRLDLYVKRRINVNTGASINEDTSSPGAVTIYHSGVDDITINNAIVGAYVVSPSGRLIVENGAHFFGQYLGQNLLVRSSGAVHYDKSKHQGSKQFINFEGYTTGAAGGQDGWVKPAAYTASSNLQIVSSGGSKVLRVSSGSEATGIYRSFTTYTGQSTFHVRWFWKPTAASVNQVMGLMPSDRTNAAFNDLAVRITMKSTGKFDVTGGQNMPATPISYSTAGHWCDLVVNYATGVNNFSFYVDGQTVCSNTPLLRTPGAGHTLNRVVFKADTTGGASGGQEVDYLSFGDSGNVIASTQNAAPVYSASWSEQP